MGRPNPSTPLRHPLTWVRIENRWRLKDLAEMVSARLGSESTPRAAWRWENGTTPGIETQEVLAELVGLEWRAVYTQPWPYWLPLGERSDLGTQWTFEGTEQVLDRILGGRALSVTDRREFLTLSVGSFAALATQWADTPAGPLPQGMDLGGVELLTSIEQRLPLLRRREERLGGGAILASLDAELRTANALLKDRSCGTAATARLLSVIAELARMAGWACVDCGLYAAAERYFMAGLRAAHSGGDRLSGANVLKCLSLQLVDLDRPTEARDVATIASERASGGPARVRAMLMVRQARTHAALGERRLCETLLGRAEETMSAADADEQVPQWAAYFDDAEFCAQVAASYQLLNRHDVSDSWLDQAQRLQAPDRERDGITYRVWRAGNATQLGETEAACAHLRAVLPGFVHSTSIRNRMRLTEVHTALVKRAGDSAAVRELDEEVRSLVA